MNILQNDILRVIGVTISALALILFTSNNMVIAEVYSASLVEKPTDSSAEELERKVLINASTVLSKNALMGHTLSAENALQKTSGNNFLPSVSAMFPPPVGPFQIAQPNGFGLLGAPNNTARINSVSIAPRVMKQHAPRTIKNMNRQAPHLPQVIANPRYEPELPAKMMRAPVNRLIKPQAPVQKRPAMLTAPKMHYMHVPVPMVRQAPQRPTMGTYNSRAQRKNTQQPALQLNK